jgi:phage tail sheath gpL-like
MAFLNDAVLDAALNFVKNNGQDLYITSAEATTFVQAKTTFALGNKTGISIGVPGDATPNGRKVTVATISDGAVTATGTAAFYAIVDETNDILIATGQLSATQSVTSGNTFTLTEFDVTVPDAVNA